MLCPLRRPASAGAAVARGRLGGVRGCSEVVETRLWGAAEADSQTGKSRAGSVRASAALGSLPESQVGTSRLAQKMVRVRTPDPGASLELLLILPAACQNLSVLSQSQSRERRDRSARRPLPLRGLDLGPYFPLTSTTNSQISALAGAYQRGKVHARAPGLRREGAAGRRHWRVNVPSRSSPPSWGVSQQPRPDFVESQVPLGPRVGKGYSSNRLPSPCANSGSPPGGCGTQGSPPK